MKKHPFFEGWYIKHQSEDGVLALIPSRHRDARGWTFSSLQIVTDTKAYSFQYPAGRFLSSPDTFHVTLDTSVFSASGIHLNIKNKDLTLTGDIAYGAWTPLESDIMGPFRFLPFMQCRHGILSMSHPLTGSICINGKTMDFNHGLGYMEKDMGRSFPSDYLWTCCSWMDAPGGMPCSLMLSIAAIPYAGIRFTGCICAILYRGRQYRLATYSGVKILEYTDRGAILRQGDDTLHVNLLEAAPLPLSAPAMGAMTRVIHESPSCRVRYQFFHGRTKVFDIISDSAGFETGK